MTVVRIPTHEAIATSSAVTLLELGHSSLVVPKGLYLIYCWCASRAETARRDLFPLATKLFSLADQQSSDADSECADLRPQLLWSCYFNQSRVNDTLKSAVDGVCITNSPTDELDYGRAIDEVRNICISSRMKRQCISTVASAVLFSVHELYNAAALLGCGRDTRAARSCIDFPTFGRHYFRLTIQHSYSCF